MARALAALAIVAVVAIGPGRAAAECPADAPPSCRTVWLDRGGALPALAPTAPAADGGPGWRSLAVVGGLYAGFGAWAYLAWYRDVPENDAFEWGHDGWFGRNTYAGGADKVGHAWATMVLARATTGVLRLDGWDRTTAAITGSALSWALFLAVEVKDAYYYQFSTADAAFNTAGAVLSALLVTQPRLDALIDFRVAYRFSPEYLGLWRGEYYGSKAGNSLNIAEDYSGQTYVLALHLDAVPRPRATPRPIATALDYLDLTVGFETRRYKPDAAPGAIPTQELFLGVTVNLQHVLDRTLGRGGRRARRLRDVGHVIAEHLVPPLMVPLVGVDRAATGPAPEQ